MNRAGLQKLRDRLAYHLWLAREAGDVETLDRLEAVNSRVEAISYNPTGAKEFCAVIGVLTSDPLLLDLYNWKSLKNC